MYEYAFNLAQEPQDSFETEEEAFLYLKQICERSNVLHLSYRYTPPSSDEYYNPEKDIWIATYDPEYMLYYNQHFAPRGDLMLETVRADCKMVDWVDWVESDDVTQNLLAAATPYGITKYGITLPLRELERGTVMFSVNIDCNDRNWSRARGDLFLRFLSFGHFFHHRMRPLLARIKAETKGYTRAA